MTKVLSWRHLYRSSVAALWIGNSLVGQVWLTQRAEAQTSNYCKFTQEVVTQKENLRQNALKGNPDADKGYKAILKQHGDYLKECRDRTWPQTQAVWLRLYPCDIRAGAIDYILDRIVNRGYNQVYLEVFFDGQVLLPSSDNPTVWPSVLRSPGTERVDVLAQTIQKGRERGLEVYAWLFSMNFGYNYSQIPNRQGALAINGRGENSINYVRDQSQTFIDPYNNQAKSDYYQLVQAVLRRRPDGILFDYIRYPRGSGSDSVASNVKDLWIYSEASTQALYGRALNNQGLELIKRYISKGSISPGDVAEVKKFYPTEETPLWQGRIADSQDSTATLNWQLWQLSVAHAAQGVLDFLAVASLPAQRAGIPAGAVFFPDGNQIVGEGGYDSRLQPWDHFSPMLEWHPMSYGVCGHTGCIEDLVRRVANRASPQTKVMPALAGTWGKSVSNRPSLEDQMNAIRNRIPGINGVSHFAFSWQDPQFDRDRKFCRLD